MSGLFCPREAGPADSVTHHNGAATHVGIDQLPSAAPLRAVTIGFAPSTASRNLQRSAWLREMSRLVRADRAQTVS